jgi:hypothetical protein
VTVPNPRNPIRPARGNYVDLAGNIASLYDGEICYAIDQDQIYINENGTLVPVGANLGNSTISSLSDVDIASVQNGEALIYNDGSWKNGGDMNGGAF